MTRRFVLILLVVPFLSGGCHLLDGGPPPGCLNAPPPPPSWCGIYPTVVIPWDCKGGVDEPALAKQIEAQILGGVHGLLVLGTIGEGDYADMTERAQVIRVSVRASRGRVPVVAGIHTSDLAAAKAQMTQAQELGASAVLVKHIGNPQACFPEVLGFFHELCQMRALPIFYYHYPSQTGLKLSPQEVAQILLLDGVVGIKESTLDLKETEQHILLTAGHGRTFLSGTALNLTQFMAIGGHGAMCPEALVLPAQTVQAYQFWAQGYALDAREVQKRLFVVAPLLRGGFTREDSARRVMMFTQDRQIALPMGNDQPQARLKATLNAIVVPMSAYVKPPLPQLSWHDQRKVSSAVPKIQAVQYASIRQSAGMTTTPAIGSTSSYWPFMGVAPPRK
jgi:4-hydroxy-tetrahydrodipicolinate synthase